MGTLGTVLLIIQVFLAIGLIAIILIQHGKGADAGAAFGSGASATMFGSQGAGNFMTKATTGLAVLFLVNCLTLGYLAANTTQSESLMEQLASERAAGSAGEETRTDGSGTNGGERSDMPAVPAQ